MHDEPLILGMIIAVASASLTLQHTATHCNTVQHTATHFSTLQHTASHCITLQHTASHCNTLHHTASHCNTLQHMIAISSASHAQKHFLFLLPLSDPYAYILIRTYIYTYRCIYFSRQNLSLIHTYRYIFIRIYMCIYMCIYI